LKEDTSGAIEETRPKTDNDPKEALNCPRALSNLETYVSMDSVKDTN
jgi:hypothetical protein